MFARAAAHTFRDLEAPIPDRVNDSTRSWVVHPRLPPHYPLVNGEWCHEGACGQRNRRGI